MLKYTYDASGNLIMVSGLDATQIARQPVNQIAAPGEIVTFSVVVADTHAVTFQWKFNGADIHDDADIYGATGDSLLLTNVSAANEGQYSVVVTNSAGSVTSQPAALLLDSDGDGLPDSWKTANFASLTTQYSEGDPDDDRVSNLDEFFDGTNPASNTALRPRLIAYSDAGGSVTVAPMKLSYDLGETVTLTATPFAPNVFVGWTGDLTGASNPAPLTMDGHKRVQARFLSAVPLPPGLVAFWRGETDASDLIGGHHGTFFVGGSATAPSVTTDGKVGAAFNFDGTVHVRVPDAAALNLAQMTVEAWVFPTVLSSHYQILFGSWRARATPMWYLGLINGRPGTQANRSYHGSQWLEGPSTIPLQEWTHLASTFDGTATRLYVNGLQVASHEERALLVYSAVQYVTIGGDWDANTGPVDLFNGRVDEMAIYNRALTADEVADIYNADFVGKNVSQPYFTSPSRLPEVVLGASYTQQLTTLLGMAPVSFSLSAGALPPGMTLSSAGLVSGTPSVGGVFGFTVQAADATGLVSEQFFILQVVESVSAPAGLVGSWKAEGDANDAAGTNHGALRNGAGFAAGKVGQAFSLDGTDDCVEIPDAPALRPASLTLEAWAMFDVTSPLHVIFAKPVGTGKSDSYALWLSAGTLKGAVGDGVGIGVEVDVTFSPVPGHWYHVAYTFDDGVNEQALYIDGLRVATAFATKSVGYDAQPLLLGRDTENGIPDYFLKGLIDEAAIYNRALSGTEIASIYNAGPAGKR